jgi:hypothetical protein
MSFQERPWAWTNEMYSFTDEGLKWLEDQKVEWVKVSIWLRRRGRGGEA